MNNQPSTTPATPYTLPLVSLTEYEARDVALGPDEYRLLRARYVGKLDASPSDYPGLYNLAARGHVGRVCMPSGRLITIAPKVGTECLMRLLCAAPDLAWFHPPLNPLAHAEDAFVIVARALMAETEKVISLGLHSDFQPRQDDLPLVRGKILFGAQVARYGELKNRHVCAYASHTIDTTENRILLAALLHLPMLLSVEGSTDLARRARTILPCFTGVTRLSPGEAIALLRTLRLHRLNGRYRRCLALCGLVLNNMGVAARRGRHPFASFLVDMARLFESFLTARLQALLPAHGCRVIAQRHDYLDEAGHVAIRPDLLVYPHSKGSPRLVIDAKYRAPGEDSNRDLYQVGAYMSRYGLQHGVLVYPRLVDAAPAVLKLRGTTKYVHTFTLDVSAPTSRELDENCARLAEEIARLATLSTSDE